MEKLNKTLKNNEKAITLIALVITIIVLLILAGISISMLSGDNGLLNKAGQARNDTIVGGEKEQVELAYISAAVKNLGGNVTGQNLQDELDTSVGENKTTVTGTSTLKVKFKDTQNEYKVSQDGKVEKKNSNPNALEISELNENASTYFGWDIINYAETLPTDLQDTQWQLFYAGALDIDEITATALGLTEADRTEERIWLISKDYLKSTLLPEKNGAKPIPTDGSNYKAKFGSSASDGIMPQYKNGSDLITASELKKLNSDYFKDYSSTNSNMMAVAYMMDTTIWSTFVTSREGYTQYGEYAIGGPTIELLFTAYNKYTERATNPTTYESDAVSTKGYKLKETADRTPTLSISGAIANDAVPYKVYGNSKADGYWLASPSDNWFSSVMNVGYGGFVGYDEFNSAKYGFRPIVLLNSNYTLEKTKDTNGNDVFKIVENKNEI